MAVFLLERGYRFGLGELGDDAGAPMSDGNYTGMLSNLDDARRAANVGNMPAVKVAIAAANYYTNLIQDPALRSQAQAAIAATWSDALSRNPGAAYKTIRDAQDALAAKIADAQKSASGFFAEVASVFGYGASTVTDLQNQWLAIRQQIQAGQDNLSADELADLQARQNDLARQLGGVNAQTNANTPAQTVATTLDVTAQTGVNAGVLKKDAVVLSGRTAATKGLDVPNVPKLVKDEIPWGKIGLGAAALVAVYAFFSSVGK